MVNKVLMSIFNTVFILCTFTVAHGQDQPSIYQQAPLFDKPVADSVLPPVEQRLPRNPMLIQPIERIGAYGGIWNMALVRDEPVVLFMRTIGTEGLVRWNVAWTDVIPNVAQSFEANPDAKTFIFRLRNGLKWSDGIPF